MTIAPPKGKPLPHLDDDAYPTRDGKPMGETEKHRKIMTYCIDALEIRYRHRSDVQVSGNNFLYYEQDDTKKVVSPDCYVVFGVEKRIRDTYMVWKEGGVLPSFVLEITSKKTRKEDTRTKFPLYERTLGIPEYFQFDPTGDYLRPRLQGFRLVEGRYAPLTPVTSPLAGIPVARDETFFSSSEEVPVYRLHSEQLGLDLIVEGEWLRYYDPLTGELLLSASELAAKAEAEAQARISAERRAEAEAQRAEKAEAELARLRAELDALRQGRAE
jgi:Uma2 family endonuclease